MEICEGALLTPTPTTEPPQTPPAPGRNSHYNRVRSSAVAILLPEKLERPGIGGFVQLRRIRHGQPRFGFQDAHDMATTVTPLRIVCALINGRILFWVTMSGQLRPNINVYEQR
jgi:hypothetical protein